MSVETFFSNSSRLSRFSSETSGESVTPEVSDENRDNKFSKVSENSTQKFNAEKYVYELFKTPEIQNVYLEYLQIRKIKRFPTTEFIMEKHKEEMALCENNQERINLITFFIMKGYQDFKYEWFKNQNTNYQKTSNKAYISNR